MKIFQSFPTNHRPSAVVNRMEAISTQMEPPMDQGMAQVSQADQMQLMEQFPKDFFPMMDKKYARPTHIYKHVYVTEDNDAHQEKKKKHHHHDHHHKIHKKHNHRSDDSWLEYLNLYGCDSENDDSEDDS